jgi:hypothetical protein
MAKARGAGISFVFDGRDHVTPNAAEASKWYMHHSEPVPGLSMAVVVERRKPGRWQQDLPARRACPYPPAHGALHEATCGPTRAANARPPSPHRLAF